MGARLRCSVGQGASAIAATVVEVECVVALAVIAGLGLLVSGGLGIRGWMVHTASETRDGPACILTGDNGWKGQGGGDESGEEDS